MISFRVPGTPVAQPRHRFSGGKYPRPYIKDDHPIHAYKQEVALYAKMANSCRELLRGPLRVYANFVMPRPKKYYAKKYSIGRLWYDVPPDHDNFSKALCDALTGIIWKDDGQVCDYHCRKYYTAIGEEPFTQVDISEIT